MSLPQSVQTPSSSFPITGAEKQARWLLLLMFYMPFFWEHDTYFVLVSSGKPGTVEKLWQEEVPQLPKE